MVPWNPRHIPEEMKGPVACGGVQTLPDTTSVSPGLPLILLFTEDPLEVTSCCRGSPLSDHPLNVSSKLMMGFSYGHERKN